MKKLLIIIATFISASVFAQQTPLYTLYLMNDFSINPAIAGTEDFFRGQVNKRYQFNGIEGAPSTTSFLAHGNLESLSMGWGAMGFKDEHGPFSKSGAYLAYAYRIKLDVRTSVSFGINAGLVDYKIDPSGLVTLENEPDLNTEEYSYLKPDATLGVYIKSKDYYAGVSMDQLFNNKFDYYLNDSTIDGTSTFNKVTSHYSLIAGYKYELSYGFVFEPSAVVRKTVTAPFQVEASARLVYDKMVWAGVSVRSGDAVSILIGYNHQKMIYFGYGYDITYSKLRLDSYGSHEVVLGIKFRESF
jgi:type IX secretion system PorP/SprF family membrane protein